MAKRLTIKQSAFNVVSSHKSKAAAIGELNEAIWSLASFTENNKVVLTAGANIYQIQHWVKVMIYIMKNNTFTDGKTTITVI